MPAKVSEKKVEYYKLISKRLRKLQDESGYNNKYILDLANRRGLLLSSTFLSKMLSDRGETISLPDLVSVASIFDVDLNELLSINPHTMPTFVSKEEESINKPNSGNEFVTAPTGKMRAYLNTYYTYFFHTTTSSKELIKGILKIEPEGEKTVAVFEFKTGKTDERGDPIVKKYKGDVIISPDQQAVYIALVNDEICEISYIMFHFMPIFYEKLVCRVALALTSSSGDSSGLRAPTAHHMILSMYDLDKKCPDELEKLKGLLYMNENEILISEKDLKLFMDEKAPKAFKDYYGRGEKDNEEKPLIAGFAPVPYYQLTESSLRAAKLDEHILNDSINLLRQYSVTPRNNKIDSVYDGNLFVTIQNAIKKVEENAMNKKKKD